MAAHPSACNHRSAGRPRCSGTISRHLKAKFDILDSGAPAQQAVVLKDDRHACRETCRTPEMDYGHRRSPHPKSARSAGIMVEYRRFAAASLASNASIYPCPDLQIEPVHAI